MAKHRRWTQEEVDFLERLVSEGYNSKEISERTCFTPESIRKFCYRNNLKITYVSKKRKAASFSASGTNENSGGKV